MGGAKARPAARSQLRQHCQVHVRRRLFAAAWTHTGAVADGGEAAAPVRAQVRPQQGVDVGRRGGGGDGQRQPRRPRFLEQIEHAVAQGYPGDEMGIVARLAGVEGVEQAGRRRSTLRQPPVVLQSLLAAGDIEQARVQRAVPVPAEAGVLEGHIECLAVGFLGVGQGTVDVEDQGG